MYDLRVVPLGAEIMSMRLVSVEELRAAFGELLSVSTTFILTTHIFTNVSCSSIASHLLQHRIKEP